jgi:hypothetical protein
MVFGLKKFINVAGIGIISFFSALLGWSFDLNMNGDTLIGFIMIMDL